VTSPTTAAILQDLIQRLGRSLLQYVAEAFPWATAREKETLVRVRKLVAEEQECAAARLGRFLQARHVSIPPLAPYPMAWTSMNFVSFDYLLPRLVDYQRQIVAHVEKAAGSLWSDLEGRELVQHVLEVARQHLEKLEAMAKEARPVPASA